MNYTKNTNIIQKPSLEVIKTNTKKKKKNQHHPNDYPENLNVTSNYKDTFINPQIRGTYSLG